MSDLIALAEVTVERPRVVSLSLNPDLLWLREAVLQQAGFDVFSTIDPEQALLRIQAGGFDALLLCFSLPDTIQERVARQFHESCPGKRIIAFDNEKTGCRQAVFADVMLNKDGPESLIRALREPDITPEAFQLKYRRRAARKCTRLPRTPREL